MKNLWIILFVTVLAVQSSVAVFNPPEDFWGHVKHNDKYYEWVSRKSEATDKLYDRFRKRKHPEEVDDFPVLKHKLESLPDIPKSFHYFDKWPTCVRAFIKDDVNVGSCDASWAMIPASILSDRLCIESNGSETSRLSAEDLLACCPECVTQQNGCGGGVVQKVFEFWMVQGIVSGGAYNKLEGCMPYSKSSFVDQKSSQCEIQCTNPNFGTSYIADKHFGSLSYRLPNDELQIQVEIIKHGPVVAEITVYEDYLYYSEGIYEHVVGEKIGTDVVKIIGWYSDESVTAKTSDDRVNYWIVVTSWGDEWGVEGSSKFLRGTNQCGIESKVRAGRMSPRLDKNEYFDIRVPRSAERRSLFVAPIWFIIMSLINSIVLI
ncbi:cathepsin B-like cysteine proteinase 4 isoform X1 [Tenebrio molitor]|uniref:cathepsin B-like cysteine proteinase 4 isoform X1 n=1 Tax=Tenebrio molitor TaxID=7067 RepID=UPI00362477FC